mmetsp:Transcript_57607/g.106481  ORF Transcript_57607/g.106481 Transcript_57607/m.106481 type:complete len:228 (+) Transcript_57607:728-1411(+)
MVKCIPVDGEHHKESIQAEDSSSNCDGNTRLANICRSRRACFVKGEESSDCTSCKDQYRVQPRRGRVNNQCSCCDSKANHTQLLGIPLFENLLLDKAHDGDEDKRYPYSTACDCNRVGSGRRLLNLVCQVAGCKAQQRECNRPRNDECGTRDDAAYHTSTVHTQGEGHLSARGSWKCVCHRKELCKAGAREPLLTLHKQVLEHANVDWRSTEGCCTQGDEVLGDLLE